MKQAPRTHTPSLGPLANPLVVQFWLLGLDAAHGLLRDRGFTRAARETGGHRCGSSCYELGGLQLHSSGLLLHTPAGMLGYARPRGTFTLQGAPLRRPEALALLRPHLRAHEDWLEARRPGLRARQLAAPMPRVVRRQLAAWRLWLDGPTAGQPIFMPSAPRTAGSGRRA